MHVCITWVRVTPSPPGCIPIPPCRAVKRLRELQSTLGARDPAMGSLGTGMHSAGSVPLSASQATAAVAAAGGNEQEITSTPPRHASPKRRHSQISKSSGAGGGACSSNSSASTSPNAKEQHTLLQRGGHLVDFLWGVDSIVLSRTQRAAAEAAAKQQQLAGEEAAAQGDIQALSPERAGALRMDLQGSGWIVRAVAARPSPDGRVVIKVFFADVQEQDTQNQEWQLLRVEDAAASD